MALVGVPWLEGETRDAGAHRRSAPGCDALAEFVSALQRIDADRRAAPGEHNSGRGVPLAARDAAVRAALAALSGKVDTGAATAAWDAALDAPVWHGPPVWIHGDLQAGNLLARDGRLSGVIDFGCLGVGDPACDVMPAWAYLSARARRGVPGGAAGRRRHLGARPRLGAVVGLIALPYYEHTNPGLAAIARRAIDEVLADGN